MPPAPAPRRYPLLQGLRAIAAASVAFDHVGADLLAASPPAPVPGAAALAACLGAMPWRAGVDLFFVISGFVIVHASDPLFGRARGPARFLGRRITRIVPLYWAATTLMLAIVLLDRHAVNGAFGGAGFVARSYLFIPVARPDGLVEPVLGLGWTLDFEMLFYVLYAPCLPLGRAGSVAAVSALLAALVAAGRSGLLAGTAATTWADPIVFEFCAGAWLALAARGIGFGPLPRATAAAAAVAWLAMTPPDRPRIEGFGVPAALLVAAATLGRPRADADPDATGAPGRTRGRPERLLERLGDASYATYLSHPFLMRPASLAFRRLGAARPSALLAALVVLALAQWVGVVLHERLERPLLARLRRRAGLLTSGRARPTDPPPDPPPPPAPHAGGTTLPRRPRHARARFRR